MRTLLIRFQMDGIQNVEMLLNDVINSYVRFTICILRAIVHYLLFVCRLFLFILYCLQVVPQLSHA